MNDQSPIPCPFTIAVDTREQAPWTFRGLTTNADLKYSPLVVICETKTLATGDYSIVGHESNVVIERKSLSDAFGTFTHDRDRWERELERMRSIPFCDVIVEASEADFRQGPLRPGGANIGKSCWRSVMSWRLDFPNVHWWFLIDRQTAEATAFRLLEKYWERDQWQRKELDKLGIESESSSGSRRKSRRSRVSDTLPGL